MKRSIIKIAALALAVICAAALPLAVSATSYSDMFGSIYYVANTGDNSQYISTSLTTSVSSLLQIKTTAYIPNGIVDIPVNVNTAKKTGTSLHINYSYYTLYLNDPYGIPYDGHFSSCDFSFYINNTRVFFTSEIF